jgi:RHS repeat-associated protein
MTDRLFTGQRQEPGDTALGLYNYNARFYSTMLGRFVSVDQIVPEAYDPQAWNSHSYVRNNPLRFTRASSSTASPAHERRCEAGMLRAR